MEQYRANNVNIEYDTLLTSTNKEALALPIKIENMKLHQTYFNMSACIV